MVKEDEKVKGREMAEGKESDERREATGWETSFSFFIVILIQN